MSRAYTQVVAVEDDVQRENGREQYVRSDVHAAGPGARAALPDGPIAISRRMSSKNSTPSKKYIPAKPIAVKIVSPLTTLGEAACAVRIRPYTIQGWRPTSVTAQPASFAMYGKGMASINIHNSHRLSYSRRITSSNTASPIIATKIVPRPTMMWYA